MEKGQRGQQEMTGVMRDGNVSAYRVTLPCKVLLSNTPPKSCSAEACSSGWTNWRRDLPIRASAWSRRW
jgi:hypothetical protein